MEIFEYFNVYLSAYTYEEMKVMSVLSNMDGIENLDYEDLMRIVKTVYTYWNNNENIENEKYPWINIQNGEEGYIQTYADRTLPYFIKLYKELNRI